MSSQSCRRNLHFSSFCERARFRYSEPFLEPVSIAVAPDYYIVIKSPMDLSTVRQNIDSGVYDGTWQLFSDHLALIYENCRTYNSAEGNEYAAMASKMEARTRVLLAAVAPLGSITTAVASGSGTPVPNGSVVSPSDSYASGEPKDAFESDGVRAPSAGDAGSSDGGVAMVSDDDDQGTTFMHPALMPDHAVASMETDQVGDATAGSLAREQDSKEPESTTVDPLGAFIAGFGRLAEYTKLTSATRLSRLQAERNARDAHISMRPLAARTRSGMRAAGERRMRNDVHFPELEGMMSSVPPHECVLLKILPCFALCLCGDLCGFVLYIASCSLARIVLILLPRFRQH